MYKRQAYARESIDQKGMSPAQCTGSASSYARKYALNGLFAIDDCKDADATNTHGKSEPKAEPKKAPAKKTPAKTATKAPVKEAPASGDWRDFIVPFGKTNKGKKLGALAENSLQWYIDNIDTKGDFRDALDAANAEINADKQKAMTPNKVDELPFDEEDDDVPF